VGTVASVCGEEADQGELAPAMRLRLPPLAPRRRVWRALCSAASRQQAAAEEHAGRVAAAVDHLLQPPATREQQLERCHP